MRVREVMTRNAICCIRTTSAMNAAGMLRQFNVGILFVVDDPDTGRLMGVVTDRDLCLHALGEEHNPSLTTVEDCMTWDPVCCGPETDVREVLAMMAERQIHRVPVVDSNKQVQGVVSLTDLIRHGAVNAVAICGALERIARATETQARVA